MKNVVELGLFSNDVDSATVFYRGPLGAPPIADPVRVVRALDVLMRSLRAPPHPSARSS